MRDRNDLLCDVGQLLWIGFDGSDLPAPLARDIAGGSVGAVVLFKRNLRFTAAEEVDVAALVALTETLHGAAGAGLPPLWIAIDQEGGPVQRVRAPATVWPPMLSFAAVQDTAAPSAPTTGAPTAGADARLAEDVGLAMGRELAALGMDVDFAPVLDVHTNPANPIIGKRAFGTEPDDVARRALGFARGLARAGIVGCGKHFPGHGDTVTDSHLTLPRLDHGLDRLDAVELAPFRRAIEAGIPMIMTAHVVFAALDASVPATLSRAVITGLLRERLGYDGIVVSDDLDMQAIAAHFGIGDAAVRAIDAGCDVLLLCRSQEHQREAREALLRAGSEDGHMRARIAQAAARVRAAKQRQVAALAGCGGRPPLDVVGCPAHRALAAALAGG